MNKQLAPLFERLAGKEQAQRFLQRIGLDPRQFVLFLGLFRTLSEREEFMNIAGVSRFSLAYIAIYQGVLITPLWLMLAFAGMPASLYLLINLSIAFILILPTITREAANALFNPIEASMLAHSPVHSLTYAAAKIAHVLITVLYMLTALTLPAALIGVVLNGARWFWPLTHLAAAFLIGLTAAFLICALYGWMLRLVPANWLKGMSMWIQMVSMVAFPYILISFPAFLPKLFMAKFDASFWTWLPLTWFVELGLLGCHGTSWRIGWQAVLSVAITALIVWLGLRSFSGTYFSEASSIAQGRFWRNHKRTVFSRSYTGLVRAITGSPLGLGAFDFICKMMKRDWQFRRNILTQSICLPLLAILVLIIARGGSISSPLAGGRFSYAHLLPHLLGVIAMTLCSMIPFTDFHSGSWIYLTAPMGNLRAFAKAVYLALWIPAVGLPHLIMLPIMIRLWDYREAALFAGFSLIVVSLYLSFNLKLISGIPFASPFNESRITLGSQTQMCWIMAIALLAALQGALFQIWWIALLAGIAMAAGTYFVLQATLGELEEEMRWRLHVLKMGYAQLFKEVE